MRVVPEHYKLAHEIIDAIKSRVPKRYWMQEFADGSKFVFSCRSQESLFSSFDDIITIRFMEDKVKVTISYYKGQHAFINYSDPEFFDKLNKLIDHQVNSCIQNKLTMKHF